MANNGPVVDMNGDAPGTLATVTVVKGGQPVRVGIDATVVDTDSPDFDGGILNIYVTGSSQGDRLLIADEGTGPGQISVSGALVSYGGVHFATISQPNTGTGPSLPTPGTLYMTLNADANAAAVQALLKRVAYQAAGGGFGTEDRYLAVQLRDGDGGENAQAGTIIKLTAVNAAPTVTTSGTAVNFVEAADNGTPTPVTVDPHLRIDDPDGVSLASATVRISGGLVATEDRLELLNPAAYGLTAIWDAGSGTLRLASAGGTVNLSGWQAALTSVRYVNTANEPTGTTRSISFTINDGAADSAPAVKSIGIVATTDPTTIDLNGAGPGRDALAFYTEQFPAVAVAPDAVVADADTPFFGGGRLTVAHATGGRAEDVIGILDAGTGAGRIGVAGPTVTYGGQAIGTVSGGVGVRDPLVIILNAAASLEAVQALMRAVSYRNGSDNPPSLATLDFALTDGAGGTSGTGAVARASVSITGVDDPLVIDLNGSAPGLDAAATFRPGRPLLAIAPDARVTDDDNENFSGGTLTLRLRGGVVGDVVGIVDQGGNSAGPISIDGDTVVWRGLKIGTVSPLQGRVVFDAQFVPADAVQALIRAIGFTGAEGGGPRLVELALTPRPGAAALIQTVAIAAAGREAADDFNGDGRADILWSRADGGVATWSMTAGGVEGSFFAGVDASWRAVDSFDFNGDGRSDILWRNASGAVAVWAATDAGFDQASYYHAPVGGSWKIAGTGDFDADGRDDVLWRDAEGALSSWSSTGTGFAGNSYYRGPVGADWKVAGVGDLNGDGRDDIVWRSDGGAVSTWTATGGTATGGAATGFAENRFFANVGADWRIAGVADLNGDGLDDLVWRSDAGAVSVWRSTGDGFRANVFFDASVGADWRLAQVADVNADGLADLLWHNRAGAISVWRSTGDGFERNTLFNAGPSPDWGVVGSDIPVI